MMSGHIYVVASGFGKRVIPKAAPFQFSIDAGGSLVLAVAESKPSIIRSDQSVEAAQAVALDVADVTLGPSWSTWWLQTHPYRVPLPQGWIAHASGGVDPSVFDLVGPQDSLIFIQTPRQVPAINQLVAPGQQAIDRGSMTAGEWLTVQYTHDGLDLLQRHMLVLVGETNAVVTLQCRAEVFALVEPTQRFLVDAILPGEQ